MTLKQVRFGSGSNGTYVMRYMEAKGLVRVPITGLIAPGLTQNGQSAGINVPLQQEAGLSNRILSAVTVPELKRLQP